MDMRVGLVFLLILAATCACHARQLIDVVDVQVLEVIELEDMGVVSDEISRNDNVCTLCEQYAAKGLAYLSDNATQIQVIDMLHQTCSRAPAFEQKCVTLVDYYAPLFFLEVSSLQPEELCQKGNLCQEVGRLSSLHEDSCGICHKTIAELLTKLQDPDNQLEILEMLLKACNSMEKYVKKCKRMVFEYGPIILANAENDKAWETAKKPRWRLFVDVVIFFTPDQYLNMGIRGSLATLCGSSGNLMNTYFRQYNNPPPPWEKRQPSQASNYKLVSPSKIVKILSFVSPPTRPDSLFVEHLSPPCPVSSCPIPSPNKIVVSSDD
ncbi:hypothetical protein ACFE04_001793 [Oxalis oulophora]